MESFSIVLPYDFISTRTKLTWKELKYAVDQLLLSPKSAIDHAVNELSEKDEYPQVLLEMASLRHDEPVQPFLDDLAGLEPDQDEAAIKDKWLYLLLDWLYENRERYADPFEVIERIYADFDYPKQIAELVRYMPTDEPDLGSLKANEERMRKKWKHWVDSQARLFSGTETES